MAKKKSRKRRLVDLDLALEEVARKLRPTAAFTEYNPQTKTEPLGECKCICGS